ncbi:hypothetical protein Pcinc_029123 [Petrolisthes cinctipes]|uniref:Lipocalin/cytosolic fatty-acid binding domain-containing protein n=1 Tax=Petrolisthes cinctipes TaxID=88211 RepID=A0AAE1F1N2_PETCI|nr:hypothetical protein Pcinc_029123 [Petrolisthes cinctipes]
MAPIAGTYKNETSENFEEFMEKLGVGLMLRKLGSKAKPTVELSEENGVWTLKTISTMKTTELKFKLGEEVDETSLDGRECKTVFTIVDGKLIQDQKSTKGKGAKFTREFTDTHMTMIAECDGVTSKRVYKRQ